jgi:hypothetical protein
MYQPGVRLGDRDEYRVTACLAGLNEASEGR